MKSEFIITSNRLLDSAKFQGVGLEIRRLEHESFLEPSKGISSRLMPNLILGCPFSVDTGWNETETTSLTEMYKRIEMIYLKLDIYLLQRAEVQLAVPHVLPSGRSSPVRAPCTIAPSPGIHDPCAVGLAQHAQFFSSNFRMLVSNRTTSARMDDKFDTT
jgi:hypothetical protein